MSRPVLYGALAFVSVAAFWWTGTKPTTSAKAAARKPAQRKAAGQEWNFPDSGTSIRFAKPTEEARNIFKALVYTEKPPLSAEEEELMKLPAALAQGEGDWAYTGMVEIDGARLALLENGSSHQGGYVKEGEIWKRSRIVGITMASIVLEGPDGTKTTVFRYNANRVPKPKTLPDPGFRPMDLGPALRGPIGLDIKSEPKAGAPEASSPEVRKIPK